MSASEDEPPADELTRAVVETARYAARNSWGRPPQLFALARKETLASIEPDLPEGARGALPGSLIAIEQDPLPTGEPAAVLASIHWSEEVAGCVLVTEIVVSPSDAEKKTPPQPADHAGDRDGRLTVGVLRNGDYASCLELRGGQDLLINNELAGDVVTALLDTF
jgi:hypothetical protein